MSAGAIPLGSKTCPEGFEVTVNVQVGLPHQGSASTSPRSVPLTGPAAKFSRTPTRIRSGPPALGADTDALLAGMGYDAGQVEALRRNGVVR